jgi:excisionase family DNA binding protein
MNNDEKKLYFSTAETARILDISRIAVLKKIYEGKLSATKVGRNYIIAREDVEACLGSVITPKQKKEIEAVVKRATKEYRVAFKRMGEEI